MVTETQVREADPLLDQIDEVNALIVQINAAAAAGGWQSNYVTFFDNTGQSQTLLMTALPAATVLNDLFQLAQSTLSSLEQQLAQI